MTSAHETLGRALKTRRRALDLTQKELGKLAQCGRLFVQSLERGKPTVRLDKLLDVMQILGLEFALRNGSSGIEETSHDAG